jgi:hypothetical protein
MSDVHVGDNPVYASLTGPHAGFAEREGRAVRYPADVTPFLAPPDDADAIRLYESLGFRLRRAPTFLAVRVPAGEPDGPSNPAARPITPTLPTST